MALYERIVGLERPKLSPHAFMAVLAERRRGQLNNQQVGDALELTQSERQEVLTLVQRVNSDALTAIEVHDVLLLGEQRTPPYDTVAAIKTRLGV